jgi:uncharacterized protein (TIGR02996 family)
MIVTENMTMLYASVVANPRDDTVRLVYCDALDETGDIDNEQRAEFIRNQIELATIGPPRLTLEGMLAGHGPNYYQITAIESDGLKRGQRVDFKGDILGQSRKKQTNKRGLLVHNVEPDDPALGSVLVTLKEDEHSKPYPKKLVSELTKRCEYLITPLPNASMDLWTPAIPPTGERVGDWVGDLLDFRIGVIAKPPPNGHRIEREWLERYVHNHSRGFWCWERGFISRIGCTWQHWGLFGDYLVERTPICNVELTGYPTWDFFQPGPRALTIAGKRIEYSEKEWEGIFRVHPNEEWWIGQVFHLNRRWPSIPVDGWTLDVPDLGTDGDYGDAENMTDDEIENTGVTDEF